MGDIESQEMSKDEGLGNPERIRDLFNRSPHPYHRRSFNSFGRSPLARAGSRAFEDAGKDGSGNFIRSNTCSSDSGTEADDEKPILRALTAPPLRFKNGLKGNSSNDDSVSTQNGLEEEEEESRFRLLDGHAVLERRKSGRSKISRKSKGHERPGLELTRRISECVIFGSICWISLHKLDSGAIRGTPRPNGCCKYTH